MCWALIPCQSLSRWQTCLVRDRSGQTTAYHRRSNQPAGPTEKKSTCFRIASLQDFITRLTKAGIAYEDLQGTPGAITFRPDGIQ
jgi:hypothetical protein